MRALLISRPKHPVAREDFPAFIEAFAAWRERYRPLMESFLFFASGAGGGGVVNAPDEATLARMMAEYPFGPYSDTDIYPVIDGDAGIAMWREVLRQMGDQRG